MEIIYSIQCETALSSVLLSLPELPPMPAAQLSCQLSARDLSTTISTIDTAALTLDPENCPYCAKAMTNESEVGTEGNDTPGDSDSEGMYEFTQDLRHRDRRDSRQPKKQRLRLGKTAATVVRFWRLVCDTFRKIVDSKYFGRGIMIAILINTLSMGIEYHEQVSWCLFFYVLYADLEWCILKRGLRTEVHASSLHENIPYVRQTV